MYSLPFEIIIINLIYGKITFWRSFTQYAVCQTIIVRHKNFDFSFFPLGAQGPADRYSSPEHSGRALQLAAFSRTSTLSLRKHFHAGIWRP